MQMTRHEAVQAYLAGGIETSAVPTSRGTHGLKSSLVQHIDDQDPDGLTDD